MMHHRELLARSCLIIAGPSGVGKSTLAYNLVQNRDDITILRNYTTRLPRPDDIPEEMEFISRSEYDKRSAANDFFFERRKIGVNYGYSKASIKNRPKKRFVLMFRSTGAAAFAAVNPKIPIVFLTAPISHLYRIAGSRRVAVKEIQETIKANEVLWSKTISFHSTRGHSKATAMQSAPRRWLYNDVTLPGSLGQLMVSVNEFLESL